MGSQKNSKMDLCHNLPWKLHNGTCMKIHLYLQATQYLSKYPKKIINIFLKICSRAEKAASCKNVFSQLLPAKMYLHQKCLSYSHNTNTNVDLKKYLLAANSSHKNVFYIDYQASRSPLTCKQVRGGTSLGKGSHPKKKSASIWNFSKRPWPPPLCFWHASRNFLNPYFIWTKVPQSV